MKNIRIVLMPIISFDRKEAEHLEANILSDADLELLTKKGASFYEVTDFMDLCNDEIFNVDECWITYIELNPHKEPLINYDTFLFLQLLQVHDKAYSEMEYDLLWEQGLKEYEIFLEKIGFSPNKGSYASITDYFEMYYKKETIEQVIDTYLKENSIKEVTREVINSIKEKLRK